MDLRGAGGGDDVAAVTARVQYTLTSIILYAHMPNTDTRTHINLEYISIRIDVTNVVITFLLTSERTLCRPTPDIPAVHVYKICCGVSK